MKNTHTQMLLTNVFNTPAPVKEGSDRYMSLSSTGSWSDIYTERQTYRRIKNEEHQKTTKKIVSNVFNTPAHVKEESGRCMGLSSTGPWSDVIRSALIAGGRSWTVGLSRGRYHGGRRPSSDDSLYSPTVIPPSALDKPSVMKRCHRRRTTR